MTVTVKGKNQIVVPASIQRRARIKTGDRLQFNVSAGIITIAPALPSADEEYTPKQRRILNAQLAEGLDDIRKGRVSPKFDTVDELLTSLKSGRKSRGQRRTKARGK